jgi:hypothetical protein
MDNYGPETDVLLHQIPADDNGDQAALDHSGLKL